MGQGSVGKKADLKADGSGSSKRKVLGGSRRNMYGFQEYQRY